MIQLHAINLAQKCWSQGEGKYIVVYKSGWLKNTRIKDFKCHLLFQKPSFARHYARSFDIRACEIVKCSRSVMELLAWTWSLLHTATQHYNTWALRIGTCAAHSHPSDKTYSRPALHRPHLLPHLVSPVPCSWVSDNLFSCLGPHLKHQMLRRLDITFIRWAFPKIRGFKHNCNYSPSLDDGINNGPDRFDGIKEMTCPSDSFK